MPREVKPTGMSGSKFFRRTREADGRPANSHNGDDNMRPSEINEESVTWRGDVWAGFIRSKNWSSQLDASRERLLLSGPRNMGYVLAPSQVREIGPAIGKLLFYKWQIRRAIRIVHCHKDIPEKLVFQARKTRTSVMLKELGALGYNAPPKRRAL